MEDRGNHRKDLVLSRGHRGRTVGESEALRVSERKSYKSVIAVICVRVAGVSAGFSDEGCRAGGELLCKQMWGESLSAGVHKVQVSDEVSEALFLC